MNTDLIECKYQRLHMISGSRQLYEMVNWVTIPCCSNGIVWDTGVAAMSSLWICRVLLNSSLPVVWAARATILCTVCSSGVFSRHAVTGWSIAWKTGNVREFDSRPENVTELTKSQEKSLVMEVCWVLTSFSGATQVFSRLLRILYCLF